MLSPRIFLIISYSYSTDGRRSVRIYGTIIALTINYIIIIARTGGRLERSAGQERGGGGGGAPPPPPALPPHPGKALGKGEGKGRGKGRGKGKHKGRG